MSQSCNVCSREVTGPESITCGRCSLIYHPGCVNVRMSDLAYLNDSQEAWTCSDCGKKRVLRSNSTSSTSSGRSRVNAEALTIEHFNKLMSSIQALSSDIADVKTTQRNIQSELSHVNAQLTKHSESIEINTDSIARCRSDLDGRFAVVSGCQADLDDLKNSYRQVIEQVGQLQVQIQASQSTSTNAEVPSGSAHPSVGQVPVDASEKLRKAHNLIVYALPETPNDEARVREIVDAIIPNSSQAILSVTRIGSSSKHPNKPRLVKVTFSNIIVPKNLLRNKSALITSTFGSISIRDDKTLHELRLLETLRKQLRDRQAAGEKDVTIKYVRGQPSIVKCSSKN